MVLFYAARLQVDGLALAGVGIVLTLGLQRVRVRAAIAYVVPGVVVWFGFLRAGVSPSLAGVVMGALAPAASSAARAEAALHPWVAFGVLPLFAFANAGVALSDGALRTPTTIGLGIFVGRVIGKPIGIVLASVVATRAGLAVLPRTISWRELAVLGLLGGIGFTVALFVASLAFREPAQLDEAKVATVIASIVSGVLALVAGRLLLPRSSRHRSICVPSSTTCSGGSAK
jgi:NhaA family Na+:H+ antiporter